MPPYRYSVYGIILASDIRLGLPEASREEQGEPGVELRLAQPGFFRPLRDMVPRDPNDWYQQLFLDNGALYLRWEDWVEFLVSPDGRTVLCGALDGVELVSFEAYLTTFALSAALFQQGEEPLHATAIKIKEHTIGLVAPSGGGKSTLAACLINLGGDLITDDILRVTWKGAAAVAHPGPHRLKLFREPAERYLPSAVYSGRFHSLGEKLMFEPGKSPSCGSQRLSALFTLDPPANDCERHRVDMVRLTGIELFKTITASTMNTRLHSAARLERQFVFAQRLARSVPVYSLAYSRNYDVLNDVVDRIRCSGSAVNKLIAFIRLVPQDRRLLIRALVTLAVCQVRLRAHNIGKLEAWATQAGNRTCAVDRLVWAVKVASRRMPGATCLNQALTLQRLLAKNGHSSELRIGVEKDGERFGAHAWLLHGNQVLIGEPQPGKFELLVAWEAEVGPPERGRKGSISA